MSASLAVIKGTESLGEPVELAAIPAAIGRLYEEDPDESGATRASLMNFALYREDRSELETDNSDLEEVSAEVASRSILLNIDPGQKEDQISAWVQARCRLGDGARKSVCSEQLSFCIDGGSPDLVRNIVFANLESDLPLIFWWRGEFSEVFEERLYSRIDRLIFDSGTWSSPRNQFLRVAAAQNDSPRGFVMHDLAFSRLNPVRQTIANLFDRPHLRSQLKTLQAVRIKYRPGHRMSALYLAGWVARLLQFELDSGRSSAKQFEFSGGNDGTPNRLSIFVEEAESDSGQTAETTFDFGSGSLKIRRCQSRAFLRAYLCDENDSCTQEDWFPAGKQEDQSLIVNLLHRSGSNRACAQVMPLVQEMLIV